MPKRPKTIQTTNANDNIKFPVRSRAPIPIASCILPGRGDDDQDDDADDDNDQCDNDGHGYVDEHGDDKNDDDEC